MKRIFYLIIFVLGLTAVSSQCYAEEGQKNKLRLFLNTGEIVDFNAADIDSITSTAVEHQFWTGNIVSRSIRIADLDSIVYISPLLKVSMKEMNFGKVKVGNGKRTMVAITNMGDFSETFSLFAEGVFTADYSGKAIALEAGQSIDMDVEFKPLDAVDYNSKLLVSSNAIEGGVLGLPLVGQGVMSEGEEEDNMSTPEEYNIDLVMPDDHSPDELEGFMISNSYGDFTVNMPSDAKKVRRKGDDNFIYNTPILVSQDGLQIHTLVDKWLNPYLFSISIPGERPEMSVEETAISILMTDPLLITSNPATYKNTVNAIKGLGDVYKDFVEEVKKKYYQGWNNKMCPDYSDINIKPVILALYNAVKDNSNLTLDGLSLKDIDRTPEAVKYVIQNDRRRIVHIYPKRAKKAPDSDLGYEKIENAANTMQEVCQWIIDQSGNSGEELDDEDKAFVKDLQQWIGEIEQAMVKLGYADANSHICLPIILESKHANYWKLAKDGWNYYFHDFDASISINEVKTDRIETKLDDCDQVLVDIYGIGALTKDWKDYTSEEKFRTILAWLHSGYKDFVKPLIDLGAGISDAANSTGSDNYKYDFRYGKRKMPEIALLQKLLGEFVEHPTILKDMVEDAKNGDFWSAVGHLTSFVLDRILSCPSENNSDDKRTYTNLIYNIYKKWSHNTATSKQFRDNFKAVANDLTHLKNANFATKVIKASESAIDVSSTIKAFATSTSKQTFVINKSTDAYITILKPTELIKSASNKQHFAWQTYKADYLGNYVYDLEIYAISPNKAVEFMAAANWSDTQIDINLADLLSKNGVGNAVIVQFRIKAHHPENVNIIYAQTDYHVLIGGRTDLTNKFVDMGLPSGTQWAICNLGAATSRDFGNYYAWGETKGYNEGKTSFTWKNYKYCKGAANTLTRYCTKATYGHNNFTDGITTLQGMDDAGSVNYGYYYAIPTKEEWEELMTYCRWSQLDNCAYVRSNANGNIILLPKAGYRSGLNLYDADSEGYYWTSTLDVNSPDNAWLLYFGNGKPTDYDYYRCYGRSIRLVMRPQGNNASANNSKHNILKQTMSSTQIKAEGMVVKTISSSAR